MLEIHCGDSSKHWGYTIVSISDNSGYIDSDNRYNNFIIHFDNIFLFKKNAMRCHWSVDFINWLIMSNISNSDAFVSTRILRLKSKCNKIDATKKTLFKLLNAFFVVDVISKFSKNFSFFDFFNISVKETAMLLNLLMNRL